MSFHQLQQPQSNIVELLLSTFVSYPLQCYIGIDSWVMHYGYNIDESQELSVTRDSAESGLLAKVKENCQNLKFNLPHSLTH